MANYRLIHRVAGTGERSGSLNHLQFRVWVQYKLSADDYGVCPAEATKIQGDNPALQREPAKRIQQAIEALIAAPLVGFFLDGKRRYLYQPDWQDWQRIKWPTETVLPPIPFSELEKCSASTQALLIQGRPSFYAGFSLRVCARDAHANAPADAPAVLEGGPGEIAPVRGGSLITSPMAYHRIHGQHVGEFCEWGMCLPSSVFEGFVRRVAAVSKDEAGAREQVLVWAREVRRQWTERGAIPGSNIFKFWDHEWETTHGSNRPGVGGIDVLAGLR
jgi:hypothetical protein